METTWQDGHTEKWADDIVDVDWCWASLQELSYSAQDRSGTRYSKKNQTSDKRWAQVYDDDDDNDDDDDDDWRTWTWATHYTQWPIWRMRNQSILKGRALPGRYDNLVL